MKVILLVPDLALAGAQVMVENLAYGLNEKGVEVTVISMYSNETPITKRLKESKIELVLLDKKPGLDIEMVSRMRKEFKRIRPDIIHTHCYVMEYSIPALLGLKSIGKVHTVHNIAEKELVRNALLKLYKVYYKFLKIIPVAISPLVKESILECYKFNNRSVPMVYNGINLENCKPKSTYDFKEDKIKVLHIGRFEEQKNHKMLINALSILIKKYPNLEISLVGTGPLEKEIKELINKSSLKNNFKLLGQIPNSFDIMNKSDIFVLPSKWEGMPITLIEAMATGMPIVATKVGGVPDMICDNENGLLCELSEEDFLNKLEQLIINKEFREKLGKQAKVTSNLFSNEQMANEYIKIYNNFKS